MQHKYREISLFVGPCLVPAWSLSGPNLVLVVSSFSIGSNQAETVLIILFVLRYILLSGASSTETAGPMLS